MLFRSREEGRWKQETGTECLCRILYGLSYANDMFGLDFRTYPIGYKINSEHMVGSWSASFGFMYFYTN